MFRTVLNVLRACREKAKKTFPTLLAEKKLKVGKSSMEEMRTGITSESSSQPTNNNPGEDSSPRARSPSPGPFSHLPPPEQTEPFPAFEEDEKEWDKWNEWNEDIRTVPYKLDHCTQHCRRPICRRVTRGNERRSVDPGACLCFLEPPPVTEATNQVLTKPFFEEDIAVVQATYERTDKQDFIIVNLETSMTLVDMLRPSFHLDLCSRLQWDPDFTPDVLVHSSYYSAALQSANDLVGKVFVHLMILLGPVPNHTRYITVQELEQTMQSVMRLEFFWWQALWCFKQEERIPRDEDCHVRRMMKDGFVRARRRYICRKQSMGIQVMMEKLEDIVGMVVSVLVWWSEYTRQWAEDIADAESIGLDSSVASFVSALSHFASDESDTDGGDVENV